MSTAKTTSNLLLVLSFSLTVIFSTFSQTSESLVGLDEVQFTERPSDELLILELRLGKYILSEGITGYLSRGSVLLSLEEVAQALEFAITTDPAAGLASGWFISENKLFSLDITRKEIIIDGKLGSIKSELVEINQDGIYADITEIGRWFSISLNINFPRQTITVSSSLPLPIEQRLKREEIQSRLSNRTAFRPSYPKLNSTYSFIDWPFADASMNLMHRNPEIGGRESRYSGLISGDFLFMSSVLFLSGKDGDSLTDVRFHTGRDDPEGKLLGPLKVQSYTLGDIFSPQIPLVANSQIGRGVDISNFPVNRFSEFDRTTLQGELPLNWEVELYRNEVLLDNQQSRADGRFEFIDVPLLYGNNFLRLIFYGPQGQKREEIKNVYVGSSLVRPGTVNFRMSAVQQEKALFLNRTNVANSQESGEGRYLAEIEYGINNRISISANAASLPIEEEHRNYAGLGLRAAVLGTFTRLDLSKQKRGGEALQLASQFDLFGNDIYAEHGQFFDFESERVRIERDPVHSQSRLRLNGILPIKIISWIPFSLEGFLELRESGQRRKDLVNRLSMYWRGISLSNTLRGSRFDGGGVETTTRVDGQLLISGQMSYLSVRTQLSYEPPPNHRFLSSSFTIDYAFQNNLGARFSAVRNYVLGTWSDFTVGLNKSFDAYIVGMEGKYQNNDNYSVNLTFSFSLGHQPRSNEFLFRSRKMAYNGAASVRVFLDENQNGIFDANDKPIEGARLKQSGIISEETDDDGIAFIPNLASYKQADITVDLGSLEDPFWIPASEGFTVIPRPGKSIQIEFPIIATGEIDGMVYLKRGNSIKGASNVELHLLNTYRTVVQQTRTAFDGFYLFTGVPPGRYFVRVSPDQAKRLNLIHSPDNRVVIEENGDIKSGVDFTVERYIEPQHE